MERHFFGPGKTGVVFAGFGAREYLPVLSAYEIEGMIAGEPRLRLVSESRVEDGNDAIVVPFAQQEMVQTFMNGIEPELESFVAQSTGKMFTDGFERLLELVSAVDPSLGPKVEELRPQLHALTEALGADLADQKRQYWEPVVTNIATLPKDELAAMAESFVNLTKFRRRVSIERETVGGPIDVAVVTKGDGFVWVRRKHYFDPGLNPRFMAKFK